jgi:hypothetical protein
MARRTTRDLIRELCAEAARQESAALVVAVGQHTDLVHSADPDPLTRLNQLLHSGGRPVGILGCRTVAGETRWFTRPLQECADETWITRYLQAVAAAEAVAGATDVPPGVAGPTTGEGPHGT